jgi:hypothetical protein
MTVEALHKPRRRPVGAPLLMPAERAIKAPSVGILTASQTVSAVRINWPRSGRVLGLRAFAVDPSGQLSVEDASALVSLQVLIDGETALVSNGESGDYSSCLGLCSGVSPWWLLDLPVHGNRPWLINWRNDSTTVDLRPELLFSFAQS